MVQRFPSVDPLAEKYTAWSPFNYVMGNPIRNIDPDGRQVDDTIFIDEDGNEVYRSRDNLADAIVVVSNKVGEVFGSVAAATSDSDAGIQSLRDLGDTYLVDGMNAVWDASMSVDLPADSHGYVDEQGNPITDLHPEAGGYFNISEDGKTLTVDVEGIRISTATDMIGLAGSDPAIHNHPIHGGLHKKTGFGVSEEPLSEPESPSIQDYRNSTSRQKIKPSRYRDVVVGPKNIYLYKGYKDAGKIPRSFFKD